MLRKPLRTDSVLPWEADLTIDKADDDLPGVSIVIPIFNSGAFLEKTLRSLMCNDLIDIDLILMDGGSTDNTKEIVEHYKDIFSKIVMKKDNGQSDAINKGFSGAEKPIFYWLNGDDVILPNTLNVVRRAFRDNPETKVVVGDAYMTEVDFSPRRHFQFSSEKLKFEYLLDYAAHHLVQPSVFFTSEAWAAAGPCREEMHYAMDADLFLRMASKFQFLHIPVDIAYSVYHEECKTRNRRAESITELALVQAAHGGHKEARATLDILVSLFNDLYEVGKPVQHIEEFPNKLAKKKLQAFQENIEKNKSLLLDLDIELRS